MSDILKIEDVIAEQGFIVSTTAGTSMYPMLRNQRDTINVRLYDGRLKKYDVPLYKSEGNYVLHRIIRVLPDAYIIRGDNCIVKEYVTDDMIIGVLSEFYRDAKYVNMNGIGYKVYVRFWHYTFPIRYIYKRVHSFWAKVKSRLISLIRRK